ncbi:MAG: hypothetical protein JSW10_06995 [Pseudomonadota bacterium]|nr:MAG: hypothetical protein JSW10_06995 [Pseudomonadota bacterium]
MNQWSGIQRIVFALLLVATCPAVTHDSLAAAPTEEELERWLNEDTAEPPPQVDEGELQFLDQPPASRTPHSQNTLVILDSSLADGWVELHQCYRGLDAVHEAEVVYRYKQMRNLRVQSHANISKAFVKGQSVQLVDVQKNATLCVRAEARILSRNDDGSFTLRNGPFHRKYLDGYFPLHVTLDVQFPASLLQVVRVVPAAQPGFKVEHTSGRAHIDAWFAGMLTVELHFTRSSVASARTSLATGV